MTSLFDKLEQIVCGRQQEIIQKTGGLGVYSVFEIDLSEARTNEKFDFDGDRFIVNSIDNPAYIRLNNINNDLIDILDVRMIRTPFTGFFLTNTASSGYLKILCGTKGMFEGIPRDINSSSYSWIYKPSDDLLKSDDSTVEIGTTGSTYIKKKEIIIPGRIKQSGFRVKFDIKSTDVDTTSRARVYKNGVAVGSVHSNTSTTWQTKSEDFALTWKLSDTLELWLSLPQYGAGRRAYARRFRVYGTPNYSNVPVVVDIDLPSW